MISILSLLVLSSAPFGLQATQTNSQPSDPQSGSIEGMKLPEPVESATSTTNAPPLKHKIPPPKPNEKDLREQHKHRLAQANLIQQQISDNQFLLSMMKEKRLQGNDLGTDESEYIEREIALENQIEEKITEFKRLKKEVDALDKKIKAMTKKTNVTAKDIAVDSPAKYQPKTKKKKDIAGSLFDDIDFGNAPIKYERSDDLIKKNIEEISEEEKERRVQ